MLAKAKLRAHQFLCYKAERHLRNIANRNKRVRTSTGHLASAESALGVAVGLLNHNLELITNSYGISLTLFRYAELLAHLATTQVRPMLSLLMQDREYKDKVEAENLSFL